jgi:CheY-like chemotaxis protein
MIAPQAAEKNLEFVYQADLQLPQILTGDHTRLRQVLTNLLSNAVKFTESGEIILAVSGTQKSSTVYRLSFQIKDTGIGIPLEHRARLFQSFSQVDASANRRFGGTGLGLAISKRLVELMGGTITLESQSGIGSTFSFDVEMQLPARISSALSDYDLAPLSGKRALIVDDHPLTCQILADLLQSWGMRAEFSGSMSDAVAAILATGHFDLALIDANLPDVSGTLLSAQLKKLSGDQPIHTILLNTFSRPHTGATSALIDAWLYKPVKPYALLKIILKVFSNGAMIENKPQTPEALVLQVPPNPLRILVAEDDPVNQKVTLSMLKRLGYSPDLVVSGKEVLAAASNQIYDLIFMDIQMPEMDGIEATLRLRRHLPLERQPRIIAMTATVLAEDREYYLTAGMDGCLRKPFIEADLRQALLSCPRLPALDQTRNESMGTSPIATNLIERLEKQVGEEAQSMLVELAKIFLSDGPIVYKNLKIAVEQNHPKEIHHWAHKLKGSGAAFGADRLVLLCQKMELLARENPCQIKDEQLTAIQLELTRVLQALQELVSA